MRWAIAVCVVAGIVGWTGCQGDAPARGPAARSERQSLRPPGAIDGEPDCFVMLDAEPDFGEPPLTVQFVAEASCTATPIAYTWEFGDGSTGDSRPRQSHTYEHPGEYVAVVRVSSPDGGASDDEMEISVDSASAD